MGHRDAFEDALLPIALGVLPVGLFAQAGTRQSPVP